MQDEDDAMSEGSADTPSKKNREPHKLVPTNVLRFMKVSGKDRGLLGIKKIRDKRYLELEDIKQRMLVRVIKKMVWKIGK